MQVEISLDAANQLVSELKYSWMSMENNALKGWFILFMEQVDSENAKVENEAKNGELDIYDN